VILAKVDMQQAAELVREYWREWLEGLAVAERLKPSTAYLEGICFVAATDVSERKITTVEVGPCKEVMAACFIPSSRVTRRARIFSD
jgi:hypothetical protein